MAYVEISEDLRKMTIPMTEKVLGCVGDRNVRRVYFRMPRYCDGTDLFNYRIQVHYTNAEDTPDYYEVVDKKVEGDRLIFSWLVGRIACVAIGSVSANVKLRQYDGSIITNEFNSGVGRFKVKASLSGNPYGTKLTDDTGTLVIPSAEEDTLDIMVLATEDEE